MSNTERDTRENEVVANLAKQSVDRGHAVTPDPIDIHTFTITDGYGSEKVVTNSFEQYLPAPRRQRGTTTVTDTESFIQLVAAQTRRWSTPEQAVIFADVDQFNVTAILNFDDWKDHRVSLAMQRSPEWLLWKSLDNKLVTQSTFAQHLSDGRRSILSPDAATLMEIAQTFKAKRNVSYESGVRLQSGDVQFTYHEETKAGAGVKGNIEIPERFELNLPVFLGGTAFKLGADLRYNADKDGLGLGYRLDNPDEVVRAAFATVLSQIGTDLGEGHLLLQGKAPQSITAI